MGGAIVGGDWEVGVVKVVCVLDEGILNTDISVFNKHLIRFDNIKSKMVTAPTYMKFSCLDSM